MTGQNSDKTNMALVASPMQRGIQLSKISPAFLHANSTSHTWAFSAFAELIDNAYDPDVSASELLIDKLEINGRTCLIFLDNGAGMDTDKLVKMLSFGFCEKQVYERMLSHLPIGHYGNGFKSGSMRLAKDALVFTRCQNSASIGFLSQTYLKAIEADSVFIPIITYRLPKLERIKSEQSRNNLNAILKYSVFKTEQDLKEELYALEGSMTGTKIILSDLRRLKDGTLELDFSSDESDIRCPEAHEVDLTSVYHRPVQLPTSEYKHSLRVYCSILFLRPRMKITIRGRRVKSRLISKSLYNTEIDSYKPTWLNRPLKITFGFTCQMTKTEDYGMMLYHRNRLIKAFEKVGYQKQPNDLGIGVVGVAQVDFLQPTHNKQDFNRDEKFYSVMMAFSNKLNDYWNEKKQSTPVLSINQERTVPDWLWAQCDQCLKWRRLPDGFHKDSLPDQWFCRLNPDATHNRCEIPEEPEDEDLAVKPSYVKTFKRKKKEKQRQEEYDKHRQDMERQMIRERELKQKNVELMVLRRGTNQMTLNHKPFSESPAALNNLHRALAEARQREEEHKRVIQKMKEEKKQMEVQKRSLVELAESLKHPKGKKQNVVEQFSQLPGTMAQEHPGTSNVTLQKRKLDSESAGSPRTSKMIRSHPKEEPIQLYNNITQRSSASEKNSNTSKSNVGQSSPLKVKVGGLFHSSNIRDRENVNKNNSSSSKRGFSANSRKNNKAANETHVDLTEDIDYEITINEDYDSNENLKPDVNELNAALKMKRKEAEVDIKPDKKVLDQSSEKLAKERPAALDILSDVKKERIPEIETVVEKESSLQKEPTPDNESAPEKDLSIVPSSVDSVDDGSPPGQDATNESDTEMPPVDTLSSNVDKVMAALENKFKKSLSKEKKSNHDDNDEQCSSGNEVEDVANEETGAVDCVQNDEHMEDDDMVEIYSDDEDDLLYGVVIKKEIDDGDKTDGDNRAISGMETESDERVSRSEDDSDSYVPDESSPVNKITKESEVSDQTDSNIAVCSNFEEGNVHNDNDNPGGNNASCSISNAGENEDSDNVSEAVKEIDVEMTDCRDEEADEKVGDGVSDSNKMEEKETLVESEKNIKDDSDKKNKKSSNTGSAGVENRDDSDKENVIVENSDTKKDCSVAESYGDDNEDDGGDDDFDEDYRNEVQKNAELGDDNFEEAHFNDNDFLNGENKDRCYKESGHKTINENREQQMEEDAWNESHHDNEVGDSKGTSNNESSHKTSNENIKEQMEEDDNSLLPALPIEEELTVRRDQGGEINRWNVSPQAEYNICHKESQSDPISFDIDGNVNKVNVERLEKTEQRFQSFLKNVHHLLGLLCPDAELGDVRDTEQMVKDMIEVHGESQENSLS